MIHLGRGRVSRHNQHAGLALNPFGNSPNALKIGSCPSAPWSIEISMRMMLVSVSALAVLLLGFYGTLENPLDDLSLGSVQSLLPEEEPIEVFLVGSPAGVERMRRVVDPDQIVARTPGAIALKGGRLFAARQGAVGASLSAAGWSDRTLEILVVTARDNPGPMPQGPTADGSSERMARLSKLMKQKSLSAGEQLFVLQAMNDGVTGL